MALDSGKLIDVYTKSIELRQNLVIVILGAMGYALSKSWLDPAPSPDKGRFRGLLPCALTSSAALVVMLYEQRKMVSAITREAFFDLSVHWLNFGEPLLDILIILAAGGLQWGFREGSLNV
jgi:hypothetical protein